jgi:zinc protease
VREVTPADIRRTAAEHLAVDNMTIAALLPPSRRLATTAGRSARGARLIRGAVKAAAAVARRASRPAPVPHGDVARDVLPSGVRVIVKRDPSVPVVAMRAVWTGGLRLETPAQNGINHLLAAMITRGCGDRGAEEIVRTVDEMAGTMAGFSGRNSFGLRGEWLAADWERGLDLMAECITDPSFPHTEFLRERRRTLDELEARKDSPGHVAFRLFAETLYDKHPYRMDVMGTPRSVTAISRKQLVDYYPRTYPVGAMTIAVVGDVDPARVLARMRARFAGVEARRRSTRSVAPEPASARRGPREVYQFLDRQQAHLVIGFPGTTLDDPDRFALELLTTILSGQGGRLFLELRDRQSLAYRVGAFSVEGIDPGYLAVYIACSPDKLAAAYAGIREELRRVVEEPMTAAELERAQRYLVGTHDISLQRRSSVASAMAFHEAYGLGYDHHLRYAAAIKAVTARDIQRIAAEYMRWDSAVIATVKPRDLSPAAARRAAGVARPPRRPRERPPSGKRGARSRPRAATPGGR